MAPHGESISTSTRNLSKSKPPRLSTETLKRTLSDILFELISKETSIDDIKAALPPISEIEDITCECCGISEECTPEYIERVREKHLGKWICGLCAEAVKEEMEKNGGNKEEALDSHIRACVRFNRYTRAYPVLFQAEAMKDMLKRAKSISPREKGGARKDVIARSSSCIPTI